MPLAVCWKHPYTWRMKNRFWYTKSVNHIHTWKHSIHKCWRLFWSAKLFGLTNWHEAFWAQQKLGTCLVPPHVCKCIIPLNSFCIEFLQANQNNPTSKGLVSWFGTNKTQQINDSKWRSLGRIPLPPNHYRKGSTSPDAVGLLLLPSPTMEARKVS